VIIAAIANLNKPTKIVQSGRTIELAYDAASRLAKRTEVDTTTHTQPYPTSGESRVWKYAYTGQGLLLAVDGPLPGSGDTVSYTYDQNGYVATATDAAGLTTGVTAVNGNGFPTAIVDPNGVTHELVYDAMNRLISSTIDPRGDAEATTNIVYDALGQVTRITLADGAYVNYAYDDARRMTKISNALGEEIALSHDAMGNMTSTETRSGSGTTQSQSLAYDELGRLLRRLGAMGQTTSYSYDRLGEVTRISDPRNAIYGFAYDQLGRVIRETDPEGAAVNLVFDPQDSITSHTDPTNVTTSYVRNGFGDIIQESSPDIGTIVYRRNANGDVVQETSALGDGATYTYDNAGRLTAKSFSFNSDQNLSLSYDALTSANLGRGKLTQMTDSSGATGISWTARGEMASLSSTIGGNVYDTSFTYDRAGRLSSMRYPSSREASYARDAQGR
jgi:YD repeat-containing protein